MVFSDPILLGCLLTVFLPLSAFALIMIFTRDNHKLSLAISLVASTIPLIIAWTFFFKLGGREPIIYNFDWLVSDLVKVPFGFLLDPTSLVMLVIVASISWLVQVYSIGYMAGDPGFGRFYADLSLFALAMLTLVISSGLLQLYIAWELVGLASYLLIGFWYEKFSASEAGKKAFVVTRFGDIGFFIGLVFLTIFYGSLDIATVNAAAVAKSMPPWLLTDLGPADLLRRHGQKRPVPAARVAARRHGRSHPGFGLAAFRYHGGRRRLPHDPDLPVLCGLGHHHDRDPGHLHHHPDSVFHHCLGGHGYQAGLGLFHH